VNTPLECFKISGSRNYQPKKWEQYMVRKDYNLANTPANKQRLKEYQQTDAWVAEFLKKSLIGHIATRWKEQPFITPSTFWYAPEKHAIYFHSNVVGRVRANIEQHNEVCFETSAYGRFLPSNIALEFSLQYESVIVFGKIRVVEDEEEQRWALYGLIEKYFPAMKAGDEFRPITKKELKRTSVYAIQIESWSGKRNWEDEAEQSNKWPPLDEKWLSHG
jgi:nitroimidazol reductase NimA-like FMN-containing flavoprotein (pyridoxamine 5'-phosphate oxidase superfamily)